MCGLCGDCESKRQRSVSGTELLDRSANCVRCYFFYLRSGAEIQGPSRKVQKYDRSLKSRGSKQLTEREAEGMASRFGSEGAKG